MPIPELDNFRKKYPDYNDMSDADLAQRLADKYPDSYGDLPGKVKSVGQPPPQGAPPQEPSALQKFAQNPIVSTVGDIAKKGAIPAATSYAGTAIGGLAGPVGAVVGESIGGGIGEGINQLAGITEPSLPQIALAMAAGPVTRGVIGAVRLGAGAAAKAVGGRKLFNEVAIDVAERMLKPPKTADMLFKEAAQVDHFIATPRTASAIETALNNEVKKLPTETSVAIRDALQQYTSYFADDSGALVAHHASNLADAAADLRVAASAAYKDPKIGSRLGEILSNIRNAIFDDAEASGVSVFREAAKASRREHAIEELKLVIHKADPFKAFDELAHKNALFKGAFSESERDSIKALLGRLNTVSPSGFSGVGGRAIATVGGSAAAGPIGGILAFVTPDAAAYALAKPAGRRYIEKLLGDRNIWDAPKAAALATWVRAAMADDARTSTVVQAALKEPKLSLESKIQAAMGDAKGGAAAGILQSIQANR